MTIDFEKLGVPFPFDKDKVFYQNGDTQDIIKVILYADKQMRSKNLIGSLADVLRGATDYETFSNIWHFVKENMTYKTDKAGFERVKAPNWMLYYRVGDCKSYSVLIASILYRLGYRYAYRFVGFDDDTDNPTHVYVVAWSKNGDEVILDAVHTTFDEEPRHTFQFDKNPSKNGISGIRI